MIGYCSWLIQADAQAFVRVLGGYSIC